MRAGLASGRDLPNAAAPASLSAAMPRRPARSFRFHPRVFALVLLVLGLVTMPVLAAMGELHELAHDPSGMHGLSGHDEPAPDAAQDDEPREEGGSDTLHSLIHFTHCCGQSPLAALPGLVFVASPPAGGVLLLPEPQLLSQPASRAPFRPPITT